MLAYRLSKIKSISFSIAMNDYGFELLSEKQIPLEEAIHQGIFSVRNLDRDIYSAVNEIEMAGRRFRDIATISGLIFQGYPGKTKRDKHMQSSSRLLFKVFHDYEPDNLLYLQTYDEATIFQFEKSRLIGALNRISNQQIVITNPEKPTPLAFPIMVDRLRERLSSEKLSERIRNMQISR